MGAYYIPNSNGVHKLLDTDRCNNGCQGELFEHDARVTTYVMSMGLLTTVSYDPTCDSSLQSGMCPQWSVQTTTHIK